MSSTENHFQPFREKIIGVDQVFTSPFGEQRLVYADWIGSGRLFAPIEHTLSHLIGPWVGNTHTENSETGRLMTRTYHLAQQKIKAYVHAGEKDAIITTGFGMTAAIVKFQRILGLKNFCPLPEPPCNGLEERPVVFLTHMEHHSNHTSWYETLADVVIVEPGPHLEIDLNHLEDALKKYKDRKRKIGSFTACSNVTGIRTPYHSMAKLMHQYGGVAFIDFAASAPYDPIDIHPRDPMEKLDAIFFSPHKFLGGPGSSGVLVFDTSLYNSKVPDQPGGGTVDWTNAWGEYKFVDNIEVREDGGTPGFLQAMKTALAMDLKEKMELNKIHEREKEMVAWMFRELRKIPGLHILAEHIQERLGVFSFYIENIHYNLAVRLLSDKFGIQARGGCACAGTYGHYLLDVSYEKSKRITERINTGDLSQKPGWIRISVHPTTTSQEMSYIIHALTEIQKNHRRWGETYTYNKQTNEFNHPRDEEGLKMTQSLLQVKM